MRRRRRLYLRWIGALVFGPVLELAWWLMNRSPRWVMLGQSASLAWTPERWTGGGDVL